MNRVGQRQGGEPERDGVRVRGGVTGRERIYITERGRARGRNREGVTEAESKNLGCVNFAAGL